MNVTKFRDGRVHFLNSEVKGLTNVFYVDVFREVEGRQSVREEISGLVNETLQHLTSSHMTYFTHWCLMLDLESQKDQAKRTVADIWCRSSTDRYKSSIRLYFLWIPIVLNLWYVDVKNSRQQMSLRSD